MSIKDFIKIRNYIATCKIITGIECVGNKYLHINLSLMHIFTLQINILIQCQPTEQRIKITSIKYRFIRGMSLTTSEWFNCLAS